MSNLSMGLCGKLARSVVRYTVSLLNSDLSTGLSYPPFEQLGPEIHGTIPTHTGRRRLRFIRSTHTLLVLGYDKTLLNLKNC